MRCILSPNFSFSPEWTLSSILIGCKTRQMASSVFICSYCLLIYTNRNKDSYISLNRIVLVLQLQRKWNLVVEVDAVLEHLLGSSDVKEDVGEGAYGVLVATHHHVSEAHVIECADLTGWHTRVHVLTNTMSRVSQIL